MRVVRLIALVGLCAGCNDSTGPVRQDMTAFQFSAPVRYTCRRWVPAAPQAELGLFDIVWERPNAETPDDGIRDVHRKVIQAAGGIIVHEFNITTARVLLPPAAVPGLGASAVRGVTDANDFDLEVFVGFEHQLHLDRIIRLGGTVLRVWESIHTAQARLPDAAIPQLRRDSRVEYVEGSAGDICPSI